MKFQLNLDVKEKGRSSLSFEDVNQLLGVKDSERFKSIMSSISCLMTIAVTDSSEDVSRLIDFVRGLRSEGNRVANTHLLIMVPFLDHGLLHNKTINFNVMIMKNGAGTAENARFYGILQTILLRKCVHCIFRQHKTYNITLPCIGYRICQIPQWYMSWAFAASHWENLAHIFHWHSTVHRI